MRGGKVPPRLVLVVLGFVLMVVIGFQAISERATLNATYRRLDKKEEDIAKLRLRLTSAVEKHSTEVGRLTEDNSKLSSEKDELLKQITDLDLSAQQLRQELEKLGRLKEKEIRTLKLLHKRKLEAKESAVAALNERLRKREKEVEAVKSEVVSRREKKEKELSALQEKNVALTREIEKLHEELERLKGNVNNSTEVLKEGVVESTNRTSTVADEVRATKPKKSIMEQIFGHADSDDLGEEDQLLKGSGFADDGNDTAKQEDADDENNGEQGEESYADDRSDLESDKEQDSKSTDDDGDEAGEDVVEKIRPKADEEEGGFDDREDSDLVENTE